MPLASIAFRKDARPIVVARALSPAEPFDRSAERRDVSAYVRRQCRSDSGERITRRDPARRALADMTGCQRRPRARSRQNLDPSPASRFRPEGVRGLKLARSLASPLSDAPRAIFKTPLTDFGDRFPATHPAWPVLTRHHSKKIPLATMRTPLAYFPLTRLPGFRRLPSLRWITSRPSSVV